jgi:hypothetical protein
MRARLRTALLVAITASALVAPGAASAQVNDKAMAEALFQDARDLMKQGKIAEACARFEQSQKVEQKLGTLLNLASCHEELGRTASAWAEFTEAAGQAARAGEDKRADFARQHVKALEAKLSKIVLVRRDKSEGLTFALDGRALDAGIAGAPLPLDPGQHTVLVRAPGREPWQTVVLVPEGPILVTVAVPPLAPAAAAPAPAPPPAPAASAPPPVAPPASPPPRPRRREEPGLPVAATVSFAIGGAGLVLGAITGGVSLGMTASLKGKCTNKVCPDDELGRLSTANTVANVSNVGFGVAGAGLVTGLLVMLIASPPRDDRALRVVPVGDAGAGLAGRF